MHNNRYDIAIIGAGLIGASAAYHLGARCNVVLLEQESRPGYHSSGRSAAVLLPPYGGRLARALTRASIEFLKHPPAGFTAFPLLRPRGAVFVAGPDQLALLDQWRPADTPSSDVETLNPEQVLELVPILVSDRIAAALWLPSVQDIDAAALLQGFLRAFKAQGGTVLLNAPVSGIRRTDGLWCLDTGAGQILARTIVNAAGAWADPVAELAGAQPKGLSPTRRTVVVLDTPGMDPSRWPLLSDVAETFYLKPEAGKLMVSPADQTPVPAQDAQPEEFDMAMAVDRLEAATTLRVQRVSHKWAGLRTFAPDHEPLVGFDPDVPDFIWAAGFGGFGVQAAFGAGRCCEAMLFEGAIGSELEEVGVDMELLAPARLAKSNTGHAN